MNRTLHDDPLERELAATLHRLICPSPEAIASLRLEAADAAPAPELQAHLAICPHCRQELQDLDTLLALPDFDRSPGAVSAVQATQGVSTSAGSSSMNLRLVHRPTGRPVGAPFLLDRLLELLAQVAAPRLPGSLALAGGLRGAETPALDLDNGEGLSLSLSLAGSTSARPTRPETGAEHRPGSATGPTQLQGLLLSILDDEEELEVQLLRADGSLIYRAALDGGGFTLTLPAADADADAGAGA